MVPVNARTSILLSVFFVTICAVGINAQQASLNLEGSVTDEVTGAPVGCKIYIFTPSGKKISIASNSKDGSYLQTLSEAGSHRLAISGYNVYRREVLVEMPTASRFRIIKQDLSVRSLVQGTPIASVQQGFEKNTAILTEETKKKLSELAEVMRINQEMNAVIHISPDEDRMASARAKTDAAFKLQRDEWKKATKKTKKGQTPPVEPVRQAETADPNTQLVQDRTASVKTMVREVKAGDVRITYVAVPLAVPAATAVTVAPQTAPKKGKKGKATVPAASVQPTTTMLPNFTILVGKVKKLYD